MLYLLSLGWDLAYHEQGGHFWQLSFGNIARQDLLPQVVIRIAFLRGNSFFRNMRFLSTSGPQGTEDGQEENGHNQCPH